MSASKAALADEPGSTGRHANENALARVVIVGAGQAGGYVAWGLRDEGFKGEVIVIGDEAHPPYQRPPLSKELLGGACSIESTYLWPRGLDATFRLGVRASGIDRARKGVILSNGEFIRYDKLVLATGGRPRQLDIPGAHYLRTIEDAVGLRQALQSSRPVSVIGGGWIGLEVAAAARMAGKDVTIHEQGERLCARAAPAFISDYLASLHKRNHVDVRLNSTADVPHGSTVVVGIGIVPNTELAQQAGLRVSNGIVVDQFGVTSDPDILAVGDVANLDGIRLETWANAQNQAIAAGRTLAGTRTPYVEIPWFWSTQYDVTLQCLGVSGPSDEMVVRGDPSLNKFSLFFVRHQTVAAVVSVNNPRDIKISRRLIGDRVPTAPGLLSDATISLATL
ncbi:NAD(P)/FAD-dependent oxidoreductase [Bordetella sp. BOR01]|uniref:NAD(P)/FAD-dependent oxidoreductase n=1 Tax=Bordetella sp. BOR01 TaxID=2854779 RepID=UPI001C453CAE|nr:FAD-dependent oxidoreductase [Bordetella sp. BOR01]MBV7486706.1 FAD-dependent oxidoreductase [Bordetella sp. BOR01]